MGFLVIVIPLLYFSVIGAASVTLFGEVVPRLAAIPMLAWVGSPAMVALLQMALLVLGVVMPHASVLTWMERRQSAMMQDRLGPNRANIGSVRDFGLLHFV